MSLLETINAIGLLAARPAAAAANEGYNYHATDTGITYRSNGSSWDEVGITTAAHAEIDHTGLPGVGAGGGGAILQVVTAVSTTHDFTTLAALQDSSLSAAITPTAADSILLIEVDGSCQAHRAAGTLAERLMSVAIRNVTDGVTVAEQIRGRNLDATSSASAPVVTPIALKGRYSVNSTAARTFRLQYRSNTATNVQAAIRGDEGSVLMTITEVAA